MTEVNKSPAFWRSFPIFEEFSKELIAEVVTFAKWRHWAPGTVLFQRGDEGGYMIVLTEGRIKASLLTPHGKELSLRYFEAGSLVGEMSVLDGEPRSADATVSVAAAGYVIGKSEFAALLERHPAAVKAVMRFLCTRVRETTRQLETIALYDLDARVARFFIGTLHQLHGDDLPDEATLNLGLSQADIASVLGASRPKVNRSIQLLEEGGAIKRRGNVIHCNVARLLRLSEPDEN